MGAVSDGEYDKKLTLIKWVTFQFVGMMASIHEILKNDSEEPVTKKVEPIERHTLIVLMKLLPGMQDEVVRVFASRSDCIIPGHD